jgi:replication-associated recombination protein RarA
MNRFDAVQAAKARNTNTLNTKALAQQIVTAADGDARMAYDFLDTLTRHVTDMLQGRK